MNFWRTPHYLLAISLLWLCALPIVYIQGQRSHLDTYDDLRNTIITNTEKIAELERIDREIHEWILAHDRTALINTELSSAELRELKVTVAEHEKIIWVLVGGFVAIFVKMLADLVSTSRHKFSRPAQYPEQEYKERRKISPQ